MGAGRRPSDGPSDHMVMNVVMWFHFVVCGLFQLSAYTHKAVPSDMGVTLLQGRLVCVRSQLGHIGHRRRHAAERAHRAAPQASWLPARLPRAAPQEGGTGAARALQEGAETAWPQGQALQQGAHV